VVARRSELGWRNRLNRRLVMSVAGKSRRDSRHGNIDLIDPSLPSGISIFCSAQFQEPQVAAVLRTENAGRDSIARNAATPGGYFILRTYCLGGWPNQYNTPQV
jgi:hypothetical protein